MKPLVPGVSAFSIGTLAIATAAAMARGAADAEPPSDEEDELAAKAEPKVSVATATTDLEVETPTPATAPAALAEETAPALPRATEVVSRLTKRTPEERADVVRDGDDEEKVAKQANRGKTSHKKLSVLGARACRRRE